MVAHMVDSPTLDSQCIDSKNSGSRSLPCFFLESNAPYRTVAGAPFLSSPRRPDAAMRLSCTLRLMKTSTALFPSFVKVGVSATDSYCNPVQLHRM